MITQRVDTSRVSALPEYVISKEGYRFSTAGSWQITDQAKTVNFHFDDLILYYDYSLFINYQLSLLHYVKNYSLSHAINMHQYFLKFSRTLPTPSERHIASISSTLVINYKAHLGQEEWNLGALKGFLKSWKRLGYPGVDDDAIRMLNSMRMKGNPKGNAVLTMDPITGPFSENELLSIHEALCEKYKCGDISNREFALVWLFMALGQRLVQYSMLKIKDFIVIPANDGSACYMVNMPRAKQRGVVARELFSERPLCKEAGTALEVWIEQIKTDDPGSVPIEELPIFPRWGLESPVGLHHMTSAMLGRELTGVMDRLEVISERTGEAIEFQSRRFKYTVGTRAAEEGHGELVIAEMLDHEDTQSVRIYVESTAKMAGIIDKAMAPYMAPIAQAFKGMIIRTENDCHDGILIRSGSPGKGDVGKCGHHGFCGAAAPHVCYVCVNFKPWLDGPHEEILKELIDERERILTITSDKRIAAAKDRIIMAVTQVVTMCKNMKKHEVING
jgi:integrase